MKSFKILSGDESREINASPDSPLYPGQDWNDLVIESIRLFHFQTGSSEITVEFYGIDIYEDALIERMAEEQITVITRIYL